MCNLSSNCHGISVYLKKSRSMIKAKTSTVKHSWYYGPIEGKNIITTFLTRPRTVVFVQSYYILWAKLLALSNCNSALFWGHYLCTTKILAVMHDRCVIIPNIQIFATWFRTFIKVVLPVIFSFFFLVCVNGIPINGNVVISIRASMLMEES